jgi:hypothetical protein
MKKYLDLFFASMVAITAFQFYYVWIEGLGYSYLYDVAYSLEGRPYVYRVLIPLLSRIIEFLIDVSAIYCMILLVVASAVGLYFSLKYLYSTFESSNERTGVVSFIICETLFIIILLTFPHVYDISTAMFFTLALALIARGKLAIYLILFPLATLNRETTFLLTLFWLIYMSKSMPVSRLFYGAVYQIIVYIVIRLTIMSTFAHLPGDSFDWQPMRNLEKFLASPLTTCLILSTFGVILYAVIKGWSQKPLFLRIAFLTLFPAQVFLHLTLGGAWELRVYAESLPVIFLLAAYTQTPSQTAPILKFL